MLENSTIATNSQIFKFVYEHSSDQNVDELFLQFIGKYGKSYGNQEEFTKRRKLFAQNLEEIEHIRKTDPNCGVMYNISLNQFADLSTEEFKRQNSASLPLTEFEDENIRYYDFEN